MMSYPLAGTDNNAASVDFRVAGAQDLFELLSAILPHVPEWIIFEITRVAKYGKAATDLRNFIERILNLAEVPVHCSILDHAVDQVSNFKRNFTFTSTQSRSRALNVIDSGVTNCTGIINITNNVIESTSITKAKRPVNSYMAFRSYYRVMFRNHQQRDISGFMKVMWDSDPFKAKWSILAKAYSTIRDEVGKTAAPLAGFLDKVVPLVGIVPRNMYLETMGWTMCHDSKTLARTFIPNMDNFDEMYLKTGMTSEFVVTWYKAKKDNPDAVFERKVHHNPPDFVLSPALRKEANELARSAGFEDLWAFNAAMPLAPFRNAAMTAQAETRARAAKEAYVPTEAELNESLKDSLNRMSPEVMRQVDAIGKRFSSPELLDPYPVIRKPPTTWITCLTRTVFLSSRTSTSPLCAKASSPN
ncbi:hypothetical protein EJ06DRAFT_584435 [Trichodelitschia bisporula]|uniref:Mating-type protein MAT-1 n=1 Tax=Trichodelitschia bisporula TaxID=703511 RepID=A0A6G1HNL7_9PEZI|nr:hypothetical protein EJ06DRAFT_584435 [Trichodelitschia bisporula]